MRGKEDRTEDMTAVKKQVVSLVKSSLKQFEEDFSGADGDERWNQLNLNSFGGSSETRDSPSTSSPCGGITLPAQSASSLFSLAGILLCSVSTRSKYYEPVRNHGLKNTPTHHVRRNQAYLCLPASA